MDWAIVVPIVIALIAPVATYFVAARRLSGRIETSEATDLWQESANIREDYRQQLGYAGERLREMEKRVAGVEASNNDLRRQNYELKDEVRTLKWTGDECKESIDALTATVSVRDQQIDRLRDEIEVLKEHTNGGNG